MDEEGFQSPPLAEELLVAVSWEKSLSFLGMCPIVQWMAPYTCTNSIQWILLKKVYFVHEVLV